MAEEQKNNGETDLEGHRLTIFLMGLVLVLSCLFVALEYNASPDDPFADDEDILKEIMAEGQVMPMMMHTEPIVASEQQTKSDGGGKIKVVADEELTEEDTTTLSLNDSLFADIDSIAAEASMMAPPEENTAIDEPLDFRIVEEMPQFPGGQAAFVKWLTLRLSYPAEAKRKGIQGKVAVTFIVERDGSITNLSIAKSVSPECDNEALRVLRRMMPWTPGTHNGEPCRTMVCVPIVFKL